MSTIKFNNNRLGEVPGYLDGLANGVLVNLNTEDAQRLREALRANAEIVRQYVNSVHEVTAVHNPTTPCEPCGNECCKVFGSQAMGQGKP